MGPDNGLLHPAADAAGGIAEAVNISRSPVALQPISATFHGRDVFAPVAAALANGQSLLDVGEAAEPAMLTPLQLTRATSDGDELVAHVQYIDQFGNVQLDAEPSQLQQLTATPRLLAPPAPGTGRRWRCAAASPSATSRPASWSSTRTRTAVRRSPSIAAPRPSASGSGSATNCGSVPPRR